MLRLPAPDLQAGFDALVIDRIDYRIKDQYRATKHLEFLWDVALCSA